MFLLFSFNFIGSFLNLLQNGFQEEIETFSPLGFLCGALEHASFVYLFLICCHGSLIVHECPAFVGGKITK